MSFTADWLALRADADREARNPDLAAELAVAMDEHEKIRVLDLGAGTGATLRAISPILPAQQTWVLADNDASLLAQASEAAPSGVKVETRQADLSRNMAALFDPVPDLVTASAFFDLCGVEIASEVIRHTIAAGAVFYAALSYDGRQVWRPAHPLDDTVRAAFNADQRRDKGLGPALGPDATEHLAKVFGAAGYRVAMAPSNWELTQASHTSLIAELARGTADALVAALGTDSAEWHLARSNAQEVTIGHLDILAMPAA
ncbi:MAG: class I SAM-dependent methyltransferase [Pseudomonadota bacterium]